MHRGARDRPCSVYSVMLKQQQPWACVKSCRVNNSAWHHTGSAAQMESYPTYMKYTVFIKS